jgi:hypothetical protein
MTPLDDSWQLYQTIILDDSDNSIRQLSWSIPREWCLRRLFQTTVLDGCISRALARVCQVRSGDWLGRLEQTTVLEDVRSEDFTAAKEEPWNHSCACPKTKALNTEREVDRSSHITASTSCIQQNQLTGCSPNSTSRQFTYLWIKLSIRSDI